MGAKIKEGTLQLSTTDIQVAIASWLNQKVLLEDQVLPVNVKLTTRKTAIITFTRPTAGETK